MSDKELNTGEPVAWLHIQGNHSEASDRQLFDDEIERGWEQKPLYTQDYVNSLLGEIEALREKMCQAIHEEAAYCYDNGDYMLDYSDCQEIIRGTWERPSYDGELYER